MSTKINTKKLGENGLACPFEKSDPERYKDQKSCRPGKGWSKVGDINEHIWRFHSQLYRCDYCDARFTAVKNRKEVKTKREAHILRCKEEHQGVPRQLGPNDVEVLSREQQAEFEKVLQIRKVDDKFAALYKACGKAEPETYHVKPLAPTCQSTTTNSSSSPRDELLNPPEAAVPQPEPASPSRRRQQQAPLPISSAQLRQNHQRAKAHDREPIIHSGAHRILDRDSGYASRDHEEAAQQHEPEPEHEHEHEHEHEEPPPMSPSSQILEPTLEFGGLFYLDGSNVFAPLEACPGSYIRTLDETDVRESGYPPL